MKMYLILSACILVFIANIAFSASGDKPNQQVLPFHTISTSTKVAPCVRGEQRMDASYTYTCISTSGHWRRQALGAGY